MLLERIGKWSWSLSPEERSAAAAAGRAQRERTDVTPARLRRIYEAMLVKQKKLSARALPGRSAPGPRSWPFRT